MRFQKFKSFRQPVDVSLKPITFIYGENSAGKSSVIQALLLLKQSWQLSRGVADDDLLEFRGHFIDLGGYGATISDHDYINNKFVIGFSVGGGRRRATGWTPFNRTAGDYRFTFGSDGSRKPRLEGFSITLRTGLSVNFVQTEKGAASGLFLADSESAKNILSLWLEYQETGRATTGPSARRRRERRQVTDEDVTWVQGWLRKTPCSLFGLLPIWNPDELREGRPGRPVGGSLDSSKRQLLQEFVFEWQYWMSNLFAQIGREFDSVKYVGPLRRAPQRLIVETSESSRELGPRGEQALRVLASDQQLLDNLNASLVSLEIPYQVEIRELASEPETVDIGDISVLSLLDRRNGTSVTLGDVGVGVSQVLPVLMQLLLHKDSTILIEQPELHLHPRLQSRLADIIIESATKQRNSLLIETHSEHLLLRLQRRIRTADVLSRAVQVLYVGNEGGDSRIWPIELTTQGDMVGGWPGGFFDDRLTDLLGGQ